LAKTKLQSAAFHFDLEVGTQIFLLSTKLVFLKLKIDHLTKPFHNSEYKLSICNRLQV